MTVGRSRRSRHCLAAMLALAACSDAPNLTPAQGAEIDHKMPALPPLSLKQVAVITQGYGPRVEFGPDGRWATADRSQVHVFEGLRPVAQAEIPSPSSPSGLRWRPDGALLVGPSVVRLGEPMRPLPELRRTIGRPRRSMGGYEVKGAAWSPDGTRLVLGLGWRAGRCCRGGKRPMPSTPMPDRLLLLDGATGTELAAIAGDVNGPYALSDRFVATIDDRRLAVFRRGDASRLPVYDPHRADWRALAFSADGHALAAIDSTGRVEIRETAGFARVSHWVGGEGFGGAVALHPTLPVVATAGGDKRLRLWSAAHGELLAEAPLNEATDDPHDLAFSPDGTRLVVALSTHDSKLLVFDVEIPADFPRQEAPFAQLGAALARDAAGDPLPPGARARLGTHRLRHMGRVRGLALTGTTVVSAGLDGWLNTWDQKTGRLMRRQHLRPSTYALSPDGSRAIHMSPRRPDPGPVSVVTAQGMKRPPPHPLERLGRVSRAAFSPSGGLVALLTKDPDEIAVCETRGEVIAHLCQGCASYQIPALALSDQVLAIARDRGVRFETWSDTATAPAPLTLPSAVTALVFRPDGRLLVGVKGAITAWDLTTGRQTQRWAVEGAPVSLAVFGDHIATASKAGAIAIVGRPAPAGHRAGINALRATPGALLSGDVTNRWLRWTRPKGPAQPAEPPADPPRSPRPDAALLEGVALPYGDAHIIVTGPNGVWRAATSDRWSAVWKIGEKTPTLLPGVQITALAFSPDGRTLYTGRPDSTILVWPLPLHQRGDKKEP